MVLQNIHYFPYNVYVLQIQIFASSDTALVQLDQELNSSTSRICLRKIIHYFVSNVQLVIRHSAV